MAFGFPISLLPKEWKVTTDRQATTSTAQESWEQRLAQKYNATLGSPLYIQSVKPWIERLLGGSLNLFLTQTYPQANFSDPTETILYVRAQLDHGHTLEQMNETLRRVERFLLPFEGIEQFQTDIQSSQQALIKIYFRPAYGSSSFPYRLKNQLEGYALNLGGADWSIYGVGEGFSNSSSTGTKDGRIILYGYNYEQLFREAEKLKKRLLRERRVEEAFINGRIRWDYRPYFEYIIQPRYEQMTYRGITLSDIMKQIRLQTNHENVVCYREIRGQYEALILKTRTDRQLDLWGQLHQPIHLPDGRIVRLDELATISRESTGQVIDREDQQYKLLV
ncbi:MAG: hypothetical protein AAFR59_19285, partial [Bacteroidota bacterium]